MPTHSKEIPRQTKRLLLTLFALASLAASIYAVFRVQVNSGFSLLLGDGYDGIIESVIVNHWAHVFTGGRDWTEVGYFYPFQGTLGYNDSYFIYGAIAFFYSFFGADHFLRVELAHITVRTIGFVSMFMLIRTLAGGALIPTIASTLFTISIASSSSPHGQLLMISFTPLYYLLLRLALTRSGPKSYSIAVAASFLYGAMAMTAYYPLYYMTLALAIFSALSYHSNIDFRTTIKSKSKPILILLAFHAASLIPFLATYLPKLRETGGQGYGTALAYTPKLWEIISTGSSSLLWKDHLNHAITATGLEVRGGEFAFGISPLLFAVFLACIALSKTKAQLATDNEKFLNPLLCTIFILIIFTININDKSLWWIFHTLIPGAKGVRVVARIYLIIDLAMILYIAIFISATIKRHRQSTVTAICLIAPLLITERLNTSPPVHLSRTDYLKIVNRIPTPPTSCKSFYVVNPVGHMLDTPRIDSLYRVNVNAMLFSSILNLPTINGFSTFTPPGWNLVHDDATLYMKRVHEYIASNKMKTYPCEYDALNMQWRVQQ